MAGRVDNGVYDRLGGSWWDEASLLNLLHGSFTPARFRYFHGVLGRRYGGVDKQVAAGLRVLDVGCGGGFLAEEFAALGCPVTGIDPSPVSIGAARAHAAAQGLRIGYLAATGEELPVRDASFDVACCCDVLEHVANVDGVIGEVARVLKPGGLFLFDTINRTLKSRLLVVKAVQEWRLTRLTDVTLHDWDVFITPGELTAVLLRHGLAPGEMTGLAPRANPVAVLRAFGSARRGRISYGELSRRLDVGQVTSTALSYMGFAAKPQR
jgi:2-polyprenyl-6-hydroxyphenyl methylase/3-demethylubiquinone-9 3-methyltransferase